MQHEYNELSQHKTYQINENGSYNMFLNKNVFIYDGTCM